MSEQNNQSTTLDISREEFKKALENLESSNQGQEKYARRQYYMSMISAICSIAALCIVIYMVGSLMPQVNTLLTDVQSTMTNVQKITTDIAAIDLEGMAGDVDSLVKTTEGSIGDAMIRLNSVDFEGLNRAIADLESIVAPLASLFGR